MLCTRNLHFEDAPIPDTFQTHTPPPPPLTQSCVRRRSLSWSRSMKWKSSHVSSCLSWKPDSWNMDSTTSASWALVRQLLEISMKDLGWGWGESEKKAACYLAGSGSGRCWVGQAPDYLVWLPVTQEVAPRRCSSSLLLTLSWVGWPRPERQNKIESDLDQLEKAALKQGATTVGINVH